MPKSTGEDWMGTTEACEYLGVILRTLYKLNDRGEIRAYRVGRVIRIRREDIDAYLDAHQIRRAS